MANDRLAAFHQRCGDLAAKLRRIDREIVSALLRQVRIADAQVEIDGDTAAIAGLLGVSPAETSPPRLTLTADVQLTRSGMAVRLVQANGSTLTTVADPSLLRQLLIARRWWRELRQGEIDITRLAAREGLTASYVTRIVRLAFLSPAVLEAIVAGRQRSGIDVGRLTRGEPLPSCWREQRQLLLPT